MCQVRFGRRLPWRKFRNSSTLVWSNGQQSIAIGQLVVSNIMYHVDSDSLPTMMKGADGIK